MRVLSSLITVALLALGTTAAHAYDGGDILEAGVAGAEAMDEVVETNSAGPIFKIIIWIAERTAPGANVVGNGYVGGQSSNPAVISAYRKHIKALGTETSEWKDHGGSGVRVKVVERSFTSETEFRVKVRAEFRGDVGQFTLPLKFISDGEKLTVVAKQGTAKTLE